MPCWTPDCIDYDNNDKGVLHIRDVNVPAWNFDGCPITLFCCRNERWSAKDSAEDLLEAKKMQCLNKMYMVPSEHVVISACIAPSAVKVEGSTTFASTACVLTPTRRGTCTPCTVNGVLRDSKNWVLGSRWNCLDCWSTGLCDARARRSARQRHWARRVSMLRTAFIAVEQIAWHLQ